ncbi:topoisomerase 3alpha [Artemisia annua]|uniref:Topoisomerase 3alpha n=1 Tax=Artemisia annua TaxID=35608 RepID=A0A2U1PFY8_ARTAN|nr:topoisomerase 3alpha [Artemisia annua]
MELGYYFVYIHVIRHGLTIPVEDVVEFANGMCHKLLKTTSKNSVIGWLTSGNEQRVLECLRKYDVCQESYLVLKKTQVFCFVESSMTLNMIFPPLQNGKFMVSCSAYPLCANTIWLPGSLSEATVTPTVCDRSSPGPIFKILLTFRRLELPPQFNISHLGCVGGCDDTLKELMELSNFGHRNSSNAPGPIFKILLTFRRLELPPQFNISHLGCVGGCDDTLKELMELSNFGHRNSSNAPGPIPCPVCESPCSLTTANTDSNRGRKFYSCKSTERCSFFV